MAKRSVNRFGATLALVKAGDITATLEPHQQRIVDRAQTQNLLVAHGLGSGKGISSIAAADSLGQPAEFFTPAPLTQNIEKEIKKHTGKGFVPHTVHSVPTAAKQHYQIPQGSTMVVDEAHLARNPGTDRSQYLKEQAQRAGRLILLTGTPTYNQPENLAPLINMVAGKQVLPENPAEFRNKFIDEKKIDPGIIGRILGVQPGTRLQLKNRQQLVEALRGRIDTFQSTRNMPSREDKDVIVPMSPEQQNVYRYIEGDVPNSLRLKIHMNLPPSKQEAQQLNAFSAGLRQSSNTPGPYVSGMTPLQAAEASPKMMSAFSSVAEKMKNDPNFKGVIYSNYMDAGVTPMAALLKAHGIPHAIFHGQLTQDEKKQIVKDYNQGNIRVLLGTSAASEGLDLKGTKLIQILEPHFNDSKIEQVIGRGIRFGSHTHLPPEERKVQVERYYSKPTQGFWDRLLMGPESGTDQYIRERALEKKRLEDQIKSVFEEAQR